MKRILLSITVVLACPPLAAFGQRGRLANAGKMGLNVTSLEQVLRLQDDQIDLATAALIASEYWSDMVYGRRYLEELDAMAREIQVRLRRNRIQANFRAVPIINQYLFQELGFKTISHANDPNDLFLHSVMPFLRPVRQGPGPLQYRDDQRRGRSAGRPLHDEV